MLKDDQIIQIEWLECLHSFSMQRILKIDVKSWILSWVPVSMIKQDVCKN